MVKEYYELLFFVLSRKKSLAFWASSSEQYQVEPRVL